jgi:hypothetical protein
MNFTEVGDWFRGLPPYVVAALVSLCVTVVTLLVTTFVAPIVKFSFDKKLEARKLELVYRSEQVKKLKDQLAGHRGRFLEAADSLNHRLWNYEINESKGWLSLDGKYSGDVPYYALSFAHRLLVTLAVGRRLEREALYVDARVAAEADFAFLKSLKLGRQVWTSATLFDGLAYESADATDHFFGDRLTSMAEELDLTETVMSMREFETAVKANEHPFIDLFRFFDGLCAQEDRLRHDRVLCAHLVLITTLNRFGYDFQKTDTHRFETIISGVRNPTVLQNLKTLVTRVKLEDDKEFSRLLALLPEGDAEAVPTRNE